jgi:hypothetical protein
VGASLRTLWCEAGARSPFSGLLGDIAPAARMAALAGDLCGVLVGLAIAAAVFLVSRAGTGGVSTLLLISHRLSYLLRDFGWEILEVGCNNAFPISGPNHF